MQLGAWKSFDDVETHLSLDELFLILGEIAEKEERDRKWQAALNGVDLDKESGASPGTQAIADGVVKYELEE